jgi:hypothetical protein
VPHDVQVVTLLKWILLGDAPKDSSQISNSGFRCCCNKAATLFCRWFYSQFFDLNIQLCMKFHARLSIGGQLHEIGDSTHEVELLLHHDDVESDGNWVENYAQLRRHREKFTKRS